MNMQITLPLIVPPTSLPLEYSLQQRALKKNSLKQNNKLMKAQLAARTTFALISFLDSGKLRGVQRSLRIDWNGLTHCH